MPKISLIIPIYNVEKYIEECLNSAINQTLKDIEIICINDCTKDNSMEIVEQFAKNDNRIKVIHHDKNKGLGAARNTGMKYANGEYLAFLDSDDYVDINFLECLYNKAQETKADIVQSTILLFYESTKNFEPYSLNNEIISFNPEKEGKLEVYYDAGMCWNKIFKTSLIKDNKINFPEGLYWEDNTFVIKTAYFANTIANTAKTNYIYRQRSNSIITLANKKLHFDILEIHKDLINFINKINLSDSEYIKISCRFMDRIMWEYDKITSNRNLNKEINNFKKEWLDLWKLFKHKKEIKAKAKKRMQKCIIRDC